MPGETPPPARHSHEEGSKSLGALADKWGGERGFIGFWIRRGYPRRSVGRIQKPIPSVHPPPRKPMPLAPRSLSFSTQFAFLKERIYIWKLQLLSMPSFCGFY